MNAATDNPEAARTFLAWVASPEFAGIFGNALPGFFPCRTHLSIWKTRLPRNS